MKNYRQHMNNIDRHLPRPLDPLDAMSVKELEAVIAALEAMDALVVKGTPIEEAFKMITREQQQVILKAFGNVDSPKYRSLMEAIDV